MTKQRKLESSNKRRKRKGVIGYHVEFHSMPCSSSHHSQMHMAWPAGRRKMPHETEERQTPFGLVLVTKLFRNFFHLTFHAPPLTQCLSIIRLHMPSMLHRPFSSLFQYVLHHQSQPRYSYRNTAKVHYLITMMRAERALRIAIRHLITKMS